MSTEADWLKWLRELPADKAIVTIAATTRLTRFAVAGMLAALWDVYDEGTPLLATAIDELVEHPGFARVLTETGWGTPCVGGIEFPVFERFYAEQAEARAGDAIRAVRARQNVRLADDALAIYKAYPRHVGRARAIMEIRIALGKVDYDMLLRKTQEFKKSVAHLKTKKERKKIPLASTFYHQERWDDRPEDRPTAQCEADRPGRVESPPGKYEGL